MRSYEAARGGGRISLKYSFFYFFQPKQKHLPSGSSKNVEARNGQGKDTEKTLLLSSDDEFQ